MDSRYRVTSKKKRETIFDDKDAKERLKDILENGNSEI